MANHVSYVGRLTDEETIDLVKYALQELTEENAFAAVRQYVKGLGHAQREELMVELMDDCPDDIKETLRQN